MMDRAIRDCRKLEQRRVKSSLSTRLTEAQRLTGSIEYHFVVALHTKCTLKIGVRDPQGSRESEDIEGIGGAQVNATFCIGRSQYR